MASPIGPRVRPRMPVEDLVDRGVHPPRVEIATVPEPEAPGSLHWSTRTALVLLAVFFVALPAAGLLAPYWTAGALGCLGLAVSSIVAAYLLGSE